MEFVPGNRLSPSPIDGRLSLHTSRGVDECNGHAPLSLSELNSLALQSLTSLYQERQNLFSQCLVLTRSGVRQIGLTRRGTIIALLGLQALAQCDSRLPFDVAAIRDGLLEDTNWVENGGDLGLLTWLAAVSAPDQLEKLFARFDFRAALERYPDIRQGQTPELSWLLAGIAHACMTGSAKLPDLTDEVVDVFHSLQDNQGESGFFGHARSKSWFPGLRDNRCGTFSDQVYAIYALSTFAQAFGIEEPLESALNCANALCARQGELGQWWFQYDKRNGHVVNRYPVFAAHQDGTAPMALLALEETTGQTFRTAIWKGISWITSRNELRADLRSLDPALIWDCIEPRSLAARFWEKAVGSLHVLRHQKATDFRIRYEARPHHFGWLLYAFGKFGLPNASVLAKAAALS